MQGSPSQLVCMTFDLLSTAMAFQHRMRDALVAQEARHQAILAEMEMDPQEPTKPLESPEARGQGGS